MPGTYKLISVIRENLRGNCKKVVIENKHGSKTITIEQENTHPGNINKVVINKDDVPLFVQRLQRIMRDEQSFNEHKKTNTL